jgi:DNA-binding transcriptional ArsR family regulator
MRKILKPENTFGTKPHSTSPALLRALQKEIFHNSKMIRQQKLAEIVSAETRLQILFLLSRKSNLCVGDMADVLRVDISAVSHQLRWLREQRLVTNKKKGKVVYYNLVENLPRMVEVILSRAGEKQS